MHIKGYLIDPNINSYLNNFVLDCDTQSFGRNTQPMYLKCQIVSKVLTFTNSEVGPTVRQCVSLAYSYRNKIWVALRN